jgi:hypothetical protein
MKPRFGPCGVSLIAATVFACATLRASPVTNWHTFKDATATTLSGQGTGSPVMGATATSSAAFLIGYFQAMSLTNVGDRILFSYQVTFTDAVGMSTPGDNFRFALFDLNGQTPVVAENTATAGVDGQTDNWRGYWFGQKGGGGAGVNGSIRERISALVSGDNAFAATSANAPTAPSLGSVGGNPITLQSSTDPAGGTNYVGLMAVEKTPTGVALAGLLRGNGSTNLFAANDDSSPWPVNYGAVGYLNAGPLSCDQVNFQNVTVEYFVSNALAFVNQPVSATRDAGEQVEFSATWTGSGVIPYIQWRENGADIPDATNSTYTISSVSSGQNSYTYSVVVSNVFGDSITSTNATLSVIIDTNPPTVLSVSSLTSNGLNVIFSEPVDSNTAQNSGNYVLSGNSFTISQINTTNIFLATDNPITTNYTLLVQNVQDTSGNTMTATNMSGIAHGFQDSVAIDIFNGLGFALNDDVVLYADGLNIFSTADHFEYAYKPISGDFDVMVRVESLLNTDQNARAGLMARLNTGNNVRNVLIEATPGRFIFQYRTNNIEDTETVGSPRPPTSFPNSWLRLVRSGSVFTGYTSTNYGTWDLIASHDTFIGTDGPYPNDILIGMVASAGNASLITRAQFSGFGQSVIRPTLSVAAAVSHVEVSWPASSIGFTLEATPSLTPTIMWTNVPGSSTTNRVFVPAGSSALYFRATHPIPE